jgi:hypothetical protein
MRIYLRVLAVVLGYGAIVHLADIAGFGEKPWLETPLSWRIGDLVYAPLNLLAAVGLWMRARWGIVLFFVAVGSQFVVYTAVIDDFALASGLLSTDAVLVVGFVAVWLLKR